MLSTIFFAAGLLTADTTETTLTRLEQTTDADGAAVVVHRQPGVPLVALRLAILAYDPAGYAGAGHLIQHLHYPRVRDRVARVGGRVQMQRTSDAIVYTAVGPAAELDYLAQALVSTLEPPRTQLDGLLRAERELREERLAEWETAPAHTRSLLRLQLFPGDLSAAGTERAATRFTAGALPSIWAAMYEPERVSVVAVGDVYVEEVRQAFASLPEPAASAPPLRIQRDSVALTSLAPAEATRAWIGSAYLSTGLDPAAVTVTAHLLGDLIRPLLDSGQVETEHWWTHHGQAIAIIAAVPGEEVDEARRVVGTALGALMDRLDGELVAAVVTAVRHEMLFYSRTPDRMADVIGQFVERDGDLDAAEKFYAALDGVGEEDVLEVLTRIIEQTPARVEVPPQPLQPRQ